MRTEPQSREAQLGCAAATELLAAWVDGALRADEARAVTRHVAQCTACAADADELRALLADLHDGLDASVPERDAAFWQALADDVDAAIDRLPQRVEPADPQPRPELIALPTRRTGGAHAWLAAVALAAALLAVVAARWAVPQAPHAQAQAGDVYANQPQVAEPNWTDALQARVPLDDDPDDGDDDPIDELEDLNDDEVQELATQLGEEG